MNTKSNHTECIDEYTGLYSCESTYAFEDVIAKRRLPLWSAKEGVTFI